MKILLIASLLGMIGNEATSFWFWLSFACLAVASLTIANELDHERE